MGWYWHYSSLNHKTRSCDKPSMEFTTLKCSGKVNKVIDQWTARSMSNPYNDVENDFHMSSIAEQSPLIAATFVWCLYYEILGQLPDQACNIQSMTGTVQLVSRRRIPQTTLHASRTILHHRHHSPLQQQYAKQKRGHHRVHLPILSPKTTIPPRSPRNRLHDHVS